MINGEKPSETIFDDWVKDIYQAPSKDTRVLCHHCGKGEKPEKIYADENRRLLCTECWTTRLGAVCVEKEIESWKRKHE